MRTLSHSVASWASPTDFLLRFGRQDPQAFASRRKRADHRVQSHSAGYQALVTHKRDFDSTTPRQVLGIVRPVISPDGTKVAFAAVGDIYVMPMGGKPENITKDKYLDTDPAWSPDGNQLVYSSDKGGDLLQLWIRDMKTGQRPSAHEHDHAAHGRDMVAGRQAHRDFRR